jgi:inhibitor of cysteine peptidase
MKNISSRIVFTLLRPGLLIIGLLLCSCGVFSNPSGETFTHGLAHIDRIEIFLLESFPVQVHVHISGLLQDSCTARDDMTQWRSGNTFFVRITTIRPTDAICADMVTPFEERLALDVYGVPAGTYRVDVNGVQETFTLAVDNAINSELK